MSLETTLTLPGYSLNSQQLRERIQRGIISVQGTPEEYEKRIQPASLDVLLADEAFVLLDDIPIPQKNETVMTAVKRLPRRLRPRIDINNGFEIKTHFSYLVKLQEQVKLHLNETIACSQKSTYGRLFLRTRLLADYTPSFDEICAEDVPLDRHLDLWLLIQPKIFNGIIRPGQSLVQLRVDLGDPRLTPKEIQERAQKTAFLYELDEEKKPQPLPYAQHIIKRGLRIHLDLEGKHTHGVIGLRARNYHEAIDFDKLHSYILEHYFDVLTRNEDFTTTLLGHKAREHLLLNGREYLKVPPDLSMQSRRHSHHAMRGDLDEAAWFDAPYEGNPTFEISPNEEGRLQLRHNAPLTEMDALRFSEQPDKLYGKQIGSHYQGQIGVRPPKQFELPDFETLGRSHAKLAQDVLVHDRDILLAHRLSEEGFQFAQRNEFNQLLRTIDQGFWQSRYDCEKDPEVLQPIPYIVFFDQKARVYTYRRAADVRHYGELRLAQQWSVGVGGHIKRVDLPHPVQNAAQREMTEEIIIKGEYSPLKFFGTLYASDREVDRVHFGLIYATKVDGTISPRLEERSATEGRMVPIGELIDRPLFYRNYEVWSQKLIPYLGRIYERLS